MARRSRPDPAGAWHHVMSRGVDRQSIFLGDEDRVDFGQLLGEIHLRFGVEIHAYCLMGNHFHLLLRCPEAGLSDAMHHVLSSYARRVNDRSGRVGHLFGDRFTSRLVTTHQYVVNAVRYIHRNPLDIVGVDDPVRYRWSSHRTYLGHRRRPDWLTTATILGWFADHEDFHRFVARPAASGRPSPTTPAVDPTALVDGIDMLLAERGASVPRHAPAQRRAVALALAANMATVDQAVLLAHLGLDESPGARRVARHRARRLIAREPAVADVVRRAQELFQISGSARDAA